MARALARGWGEPVLCSDCGSGRAAALAAELGGRAASNVEVAEEADLVVLCHKPAQLDAVAQRDRRPRQGGGLGARRRPPSPRCRRPTRASPVFRLMPNTPVEVRRGVVCYAPRRRSVDRELWSARCWRCSSGWARWSRSTSALIGAAAAVMSVGPAYQALVAEAQVDAAVRHGLGPALAARLVAETMAGTAALLQARDYDTLAVRREVTSPGGSTARGLDALERGGVAGRVPGARSTASAEARPMMRRGRASPGTTSPTTSARCSRSTSS